jgi:2-dehydropantoate 2-reductase/thiosulfate/3-mercaptopyruvate sulfurtransferase
VLEAAGVDVADPGSENTIDRSGFVVAKRDKPGGMSTWQSFARADTRGHEVDFLNGELVLLARLHGTEAPLNEAIQRLLGRSFDLREPVGTHHVDEVLASLDLHGLGADAGDTGVAGERRGDRDGALSR